MANIPDPDKVKVSSGKPGKFDATTESFDFGDTPSPGDQGPNDVQDIKQAILEIANEHAMPEGGVSPHGQALIAQAIEDMKRYLGRESGS